MSRLFKKSNWASTELSNYKYNYDLRDLKKKKRKIQISLLNLKLSLHNIWFTHFLLFLLLQFVDIGIVTSIESNHKQIESARKGQEICIKIEPIPGESPKMFGRHFEADDMLVSKVSASHCQFQH